MASGKKPDPPPIKGILKSTSNFKKEKAPEANNTRRGSREMKWDEVNIKATFHPADKTYGHQKVDEPPTPYHFTDDPDPRQKPLSPTELASRLKDVEIKDHDKARRASFEDHRKAHYNEYQAVKLARHLLEQEEKQHHQEKKK